MFRYLSTALAIAILSGCSFGIVTETRTLQEPPFVVVQMRGDITEATRCVGRYWQNAASQLGSFWNVSTHSYQVRVQGPGAGTPPIGLVIDFQDQSGKTFALAHVHPIFPTDDPRRTVTVKALNACKAP